ncbi:MAG: hypothetical protein ACFE85_19415 [Candidatus Hodarchaeota archaeon]
MGKKGKLILGSVFLLSLFLMMSLVCANADMVTPASSATISGTAILNASGTNLLNCTFYAKSASTANSSWSTLSTDTNETASASSINGTFDSTILEDSTDYIFNATCYNSSGSLHDGTTTTGVTVDNTAPTAPTLSPADYSSLTTSGTQTFTGTVTDSQTTSCTYTIYRGGSSSDGSSGSASYSSSSCTFTKTFSSTIDNGVWWWTVTASDGTNTSSTTAHFNVQLPGSGGGAPLSVAGGGETAGEGTSKVWKWVLSIIVLVLLVWGAFAVINKK